MFKDLKSLRSQQCSESISELFEDDPNRADMFSVRFETLLFDYSKTQITAAVRDGLIELCNRQNVAGRREAMFEGGKVNETEQRAVLHTALRDPGGPELIVDGEDIRVPLRATLGRMERLARHVRSGKLAGPGGPFTDVVNIGIGGSDLGPVMAALALAPYHDGPRCHFVSNVDGAHIHDILQRIDPKTTLVIVASKTFTTVETMTNAATARRWVESGGGDPARQFLALSTSEEETADFGIPREHVFGFEDWVGGRYSVWGPIGLSLMLAVGPDHFRAFLAGGKSMDNHFRAAPWEQNMPVMLALTGVWHNQVCGYPTRAVLPYDQRLRRLPAYLQQLEMESNGKSVAMDGSPLPHPSGPVVWGEPGTNGQHAFYQLLHQGTSVVPAEFLVAAKGHEPELEQHHRLLVVNCLAQSEALMRGRSLDEACALMRAAGFAGTELERQARHRVFPGNRPSTTLIYPQLTPYVLGQIIALYEHRVFVEGVILGINSFDQWGVELGKELANSLLPLLAGVNGDAGKDGSTRALLDFVRKFKA
ncbi:glucose-6-phosphate isomerase [Leisingera methylohalidivorans]|uniref:Glucose-6-phosphate isomerase n=1 Tax=Leisingera methylohalidivorans DSM 14336 TaxID=999552 RepID=V9VT93_9RHOB|nr:glucose-6-phosphate isomerase [Leisingera methylohalidivorans]AHD00909.1 glucose-6-phosphate isomerase [Leisingera methylohalidivorans DSM 14336]